MRSMSCGLMFWQRLLHALHERLQHLLAERLQQLLELRLRLGVHEVVVLQLRIRPAGSGGQLVELRLALRGHLLELAPGVLGDLALLRALARVGRGARSMPCALGLQDLVELLLDVLQARAEVVALELLLPLLAQLLEEVLEARASAPAGICAPRCMSRRSAPTGSPSDRRSSDIASSRSSASRSGRFCEPSQRE